MTATIHSQSDLAANCDGFFPDFSDDPKYARARGAFESPKS